MYFLNNFMYLGQRIYKNKLWKRKDYKNVKYLPPKPIFCSADNQTLVLAKENVGTNIMLKVYNCSRAWWDLASSSTTHHTMWKLSSYKYKEWTFSCAIIVQAACGKADEKRGSGKRWVLAEAIVSLSNCQRSCIPRDGWKGSACKGIFWK